MIKASLTKLTCSALYTPCCSGTDYQHMHGQEVLGALVTCNLFRLVLHAHSRATEKAQTQQLSILFHVATAC